MKIKIFLMMCCMFLITGCTVDYKLDFRDEKLSETIGVYLLESENNSENIDKMEYMAQYEAAAISKGNIQKNYLFNSEVKNNEYAGIFSYTYSPEQFNIANVVHQCYDTFNFVKTSAGYTLATSNTFNCGSYSYMMVDKYTITITTDYIVNSHNADYVDGDSYIWEIIPNGKVNIRKPINISFSNNTKADKLKETLTENSSMIIMIIIGVVLVLVGVVISIFFIKNKQNED